MPVIQKQVLISKNDEFLSVADRLEAFGKVVLRIQTALKRIEEKNVLEQRLSESVAQARNELAKLQPTYDRAKVACTGLDKLLGNEYKATYLKQVVTGHKQQLSNIFSKIHTPHEFKEVCIEENILLERLTGDTSAISEISTGQRAALALSIFLSLNGSIGSRAPWLLFDDPVAHVDDLNILSFFDMLRDLVLLGKRQVFFATANDRIADLFSKKFDYLGSEFQQFRFPSRR